MTSSNTKQRLRKGKKHLYPFCDRVNPIKTYSCDLEDNLSRLWLKLWTKHVDPKNLIGKEWRGSRENKIEWWILLSKTKDGIRLMR